MAKITDRTAYPFAIPAATDYVIGIDGSDGSQSADGSARVFRVESLSGFRRWFDTVALLLADTSMGYATGDENQVSAGDYLRTRETGYNYKVAASGATDHHVTTSGGVKLYVVTGSNGRSIAAFGAAGDGATDDTAAFSAAAGAGGVIWVPAGTYLVDGVDCTTEVHWRLDPAAVVKARIARSEVFAIFNFASGAAGSSFFGGTLDGNRSVIGPSYSDPDWNWTGLRALNCDDFTFGDLAIQNVVAFAFWVQGSRVCGRNISVTDCGKICQIKKVFGASVNGVRAVNIGNNGLNVYQHGCEIRQSTDFSMDDWSIADFTPDTAGPEPTPAAVIFENMNRLTVTNVRIEGYAGTSASGNAIGMVSDTTDEGFFSGITVNDYPQGFSFNSCLANMVNCSADGRYRADSTFGITVQNAGLITAGPGGDLAQNSRGNDGSRLSMMNCLIRRFDQGILNRGSDVHTTNCRVTGNVGIGVQHILGVNNSFFPGHIALKPGFTAAQSEFKYNGGNGVQFDACEWANLLSCDLSNNGQDSALAASARCGLATIGTDAKTRLRSESCDVSDNQQWTVADAVSFTPGTTDGDNQIEVYLIKPENFNIGQNVSLINADGSGNVTAKIVDKVHDIAIVETATPVTFSETGNLTSLTGTLSSSGNTVTGVGTAFSTELLGVSIIKVAGAYHKVIRVNSNIECVVEAAPSPAFSGDTAQLVSVDASGIPSQQYGEYYNSTSVTNAYSRRNRRLGLQTAPMFISGWAQFAPGSEIVQRVANVALSTSGAITSLISGITTGLVPVAARANITTAIAGTDGTPTLEFRNGAGIHADIGDFAAYTQNTKVSAEAASRAPLPSAGALALRLNGGADNIASAGAITAEILILVPEMSTALPSV